MVGIGSKISEFEAEACVDGAIKKVKMSDYRGKWKVLIFYPADFSFVCPTELEEAAKYHDQFRKLGAEVFSVSTDTAFAHLAWHDTSPAIGKIKYPMLADPTGRISREFGTYMEDTGLSLRGTFIVDPDGIVKTIEIQDLSIGRNIAETVRKLEAAIHVREHPGEVCPVNWAAGNEAMKPSDALVGKI
jgi:peroxiredoxin (alkyl hydroperoxide reductase subunit C)